MLTPAITKTVSYVLLKTDCHVRFNCSGGALNATLPSDADLDAIFVIAKRDGSSHALTILGMINADTNLILRTKDDVVMLRSLGDGTFEVISKTVTPTEADNGFDITVLSSISGSYNYSPGFVPRLIELFWTNADGSSAGMGWSKGSAAADQACMCRRGSDDLLVFNTGIATSFNRSTWMTGALGLTTAITRVGGGDVLNNVVLKAWK